MCIIILGINNSKTGTSWQGAKNVIFTACHSGKLKLAITCPKVISNSPQHFLIWQFFCKLNSSKYSTCPTGKLRTEFTSPIAKSTSPGLSDTTFFARWHSVIIYADHTKGPQGVCPIYICSTGNTLFWGQHSFPCSCLWGLERRDWFWEWRCLSRIFKKKSVLDFCCHHYFKLTIAFSCGARKCSVDKLVILERAANLQYWA